MATTQSLVIKQSSQSIADNTSKVRILWQSTCTGSSYNNYTRTGYCWVSVNGGAETKYTFETPLPKQSTITVADFTITAQHDSNGECTVKARTSMATGISAGTITKSASLTLDTIPRKSTLTANNGTLGTAQTLGVSRKSSSFTHTITYKCGSASGTVCTKSSDLTVSWTPPLSLANQNKTGTSVSVTFTITTYNGSTNVGSNTKTISCAMPASIKPSCRISVAAAPGYDTDIGSFIKGITKLKIVVTPTMSYGSPIKSYTVTANGKTYSTDEIVTDLLASSGSLPITAKVTDARGRTSSVVTQNIHVSDYSKPKINSLSVGRCNEDGTENDKGTAVSVKFSASVSPVDDNNDVQLGLYYKKTFESVYAEVPVEGWVDYYNPSKTIILKNMDPDSAYDISLTVSDTLDSVSRITSVSTAFVLMDWKGSGRGIAFGKKSEADDVMDIDMDVLIRGNLQVTNNMKINGMSTDGVVKNAFQAQNENGNTVVGYGNYDEQSGSTNIYGHDILFGVSNIDNPGTYRPYRRRGDTMSLTLRTAGYVTNAGKDISFWIPMSVPIIGSPTVTVSSINGFVLRQGTKYTHGSTADDYVTPDSYEAAITTFHGIYVKASFSDTTNVTNNDAIGIYWNGTITFS